MRWAFERPRTLIQRHCALNGERLRADDRGCVKFKSLREKYIVETGGEDPENRCTRGESPGSARKKQRWKRKAKRGEGREGKEALWGTVFVRRLPPAPSEKVLRGAASRGSPCRRGERRRRRTKSEGGGEWWSKPFALPLRPHAASLTEDGSAANDKSRRRKKPTREHGGRGSAADQVTLILILGSGLTRSAKKELGEEG